MAAGTLVNADTRVRDLLAVARIVACAAADPSIPFTERGLREATNLPAEVLRDALLSSEFADAVLSEFKSMSATFIARGAMVMDKLVQDPKSAPSVRINAFRALVASFGEVATAAKKAQGASNEDQLKSMLGVLESIHDENPQQRMQKLLEAVRTDAGTG